MSASELMHQSSTRATLRARVIKQVALAQSKVDDESFYDVECMRGIIDELQKIKEEFYQEHDRMIDEMDPKDTNTSDLHADAEQVEQLITDINNTCEEWSRVTRDIITNALLANQSERYGPRGFTPPPTNVELRQSSTIEGSHDQTPDDRGAVSTVSAPLMVSDTTFRQPAPPPAAAAPAGGSSGDTAATLSLSLPKDGRAKDTAMLQMQQQHARERQTYAAQIKSLEQQVASLTRSISTPARSSESRSVTFNDTVLSNVPHVNALSDDRQLPNALDNVVFSQPLNYQYVHAPRSTMYSHTMSPNQSSRPNPINPPLANRSQGQIDYLSALSSGRLDPGNPGPSGQVDVSTVASLFSQNNTIVQSLLEDSRSNLEAQRVLSEMPKSKLQTFDGDPLNYWMFMKTFDDMVGSTQMRDTKKLNTLLAHCSPDIKKLLMGCQLMISSEGYNKARAILRTRFGNPFLISQAWKSKIAGYPRITTPAELEAFSEDLLCCYNTLTEMGHVSEMQNSDCLSTIASKLENSIRGKWRKIHRSAMRRNSSGTFRELVELILTCTDEQTDPIYNNTRLDKVAEGRTTPISKLSTATRDSKKSKSHSFATYLVDSDPDDEGSESEFNNQILIMAAEATNRTCFVCGGAHYVSECPEFIAQSPRERLVTARAKRLCLLCLNQGHFISKCTHNWKCQTPGCVFRHHNLLHGAFTFSRTRQDGSAAAGRQNRGVSSNLINFDEEPNHTVDEKQLDVCLNAGETEEDRCEEDLQVYKSITVRHAALPITPVIIFVGSRQCTTYALLDSGSTATICTNRLVSILKPVSRGSARVTINTISGKCTSQGEVYNMDIRGCTGLETLPMFEVVSLQKMPISTNHITAASDLKRWSHLSHLRIASVEAQHVDLLIGQDNAHLLKPKRTIEGKHLRDPFAVITPLGWTVYGMSRHHHAIEAKEVSLNMMTCGDDDTKTDTLETQVARLWSLDQVPECDPLSPTDRAVVNKWDDELILVDGYIQLPIPLKKTAPDFPDNRAAVLARLNSLGKRLQKNKALHLQYTTAMKINFDKGYARQVFHDPKPGFGWHLTQLPVEHKRKPGVRPVWNGGFVYRGRCLNDEVHQGPDMTNKIVSVVVNFRLLPVAVMGDIKQMYNQVRVPPEQQDLMRFLYWEDGDPTKKVIDCCLNYHMFGGSWSPSVCTYALRKIIDLAELDPEGETALTILKAFYVDDCVKSIVGVATGITLFTEITCVLEKYHFDFTKLVSNSSQLLDAFPDNKKASRTVDLDFDGGRAQVQHSLGQRWQPEDDIFFFVCCFNADPKSRRELLSTLSTLYDPLGLCAPFLIPAKRLLQELTKLKLSWDEPLPDSVRAQWKKWVSDSGCIVNLRIPRWVGLKSLDQRVWLVYFCDASEVAYGAVCYLCTVDNRDVIESSNLLISRHRLAPLKSQSIPRLELCAALLAAQLDHSVKSYLDVKPAKTIYWSDSTLVLRYINTEPSTLKTFVSNRVSAIQQLTRGEEWLHVPTEENPADCLSRGVTAQELVDSALWLHGPGYLREHESEWPAQPDFLTESIDDEKKKPKPIYSIHSAVGSLEEVTKPPDDELIPALWKAYSSWTRIVKSIAWLLFAVKRFKAKGDKAKLSREALISCEDMQHATRLLIGAAQDKFLTDAQKSKKTFKKLFPRTRQGLICIGGRIERASFPTEFKQPFVLPPANIVTELYIRHCHNQVFHAGVSRTLMEMRKSVWVISGRREVQREVSKCLICKKYRSPPMNQVMADLPPYRLMQGTRPFAYVGIDYMGPLQIKVGRSLHKRYVCVIVCSVTRAVHLEPASELTTSSFLNAFNRFCSRRGKPVAVLSDNGTNFVGAKAELDREECFWNNEDIHLHCADAGIKWSFNPPAASHFGGMWERHIRSIRSMMLNMTGGATLSEEALNTLLCLIEACLNSRPLTKLTDDPTDPSPLTPNLLLLGENGDPVRSVTFGTDLLRKTWKQTQYLADCFWKRWIHEYLQQLQSRSKWLESKENLKTGDLVLVVQDTMPRHVWPLGLVVRVHAGHDGMVRAADVKMEKGTLTRPIVKLILLEANLTSG